MATWKKWWQFLFPVRGWKHRYQSYKRGCRTWSVPNRPDANKVAPWPVEWLAHTQEDLEGRWAKIGWRPIESTCADSGQLLAAGQGVRCVRCGVDLHPSAAGMIGHHDPPVCRRCSPLIAFVV